MRPNSRCAQPARIMAPDASGVFPFGSSSVQVPRKSISTFKDITTLWFIRTKHKNAAKNRRVVCIEVGQLYVTLRHAGAESNVEQPSVLG